MIGFDWIQSIVKFLSLNQMKLAHGKRGNSVFAAVDVESLTCMQALLLCKVKTRDDKSFVCFLFISREKPLACKALFNTPTPCKKNKVRKVSKPKRTQRWIDAISSNIDDALGISKGLKNITGNIRHMMNRIESACTRFIAPNFDDFECDFSMTTGYTFLVDSVVAQ